MRFRGACSSSGVWRNIHWCCYWSAPTLKYFQCRPRVGDDVESVCDVVPAANWAHRTVTEEARKSRYIFTPRVRRGGVLVYHTAGVGCANGSRRHVSGFKPRLTEVSRGMQTRWSSKTVNSQNRGSSLGL